MKPYVLYLRVLSSGLLGALLGGLIWYFFVTLSGLQSALMCALVGLIVGKAILLGRGSSFVPCASYISVVITFITLFLSEYFIDHYFFEKYNGAVSVFLPLTTIFQIVLDSLRSDPLTLLFWAVGLVAAYQIPAVSSDTDPDSIIGSVK